MDQYDEMTSSCEKEFTQPKTSTNSTHYILIPVTQPRALRFKTQQDSPEMHKLLKFLERRKIMQAGRKKSRLLLISQGCSVCKKIPSRRATSC